MTHKQDLTPFREYITILAAIVEEQKEDV